MLDEVPLYDRCWRSEDAGPRDNGIQNVLDGGALVGDVVLHRCLQLGREGEFTIQDLTLSTLLRASFGVGRVVRTRTPWRPF
jgi:hypothetical protein